MIKIELYEFNGTMICTVDHHAVGLSGALPHEKRIQSLAYTTGPTPQHDETQTVLEAVTNAVQQAAKRASEAGGWSSLI